MGEQPAKAKPGARAQEKGVCIICGCARIGTPASPEFPIRAARKLRSIFRLPEKHTVACSEHLAESVGKRARFEKKRRDYFLFAAIFFILVIVGSFVSGRGDLGLVLPALLGAALIAALPFFYYFPKFEK